MRNQEEILSIFNLAVRDLTEFVVFRTKEIQYEINEHTTNSFIKFREETILNNGVIKVSAEGCTNTIYGNEFVNILARLWHDNLHLKHNLNFFKEDETIVAKLQEAEVFNFIKELYGNTRAYYASKLIWIDIYEQVIYYVEHQEFVDNQYQFVLSKFKELF